MTQTRTLRSTLGDIVRVVAQSCATGHRSVRLTGRLDRRGPGASVVWTVANRGRDDVSLTNLVVSGRDTSTRIVAVVPRGIMKPHSQATFASELDSSMLTADSIAVVDSNGGHHRMSNHGLARLRSQLHSTIRRPPDTGSARDWAYGSANLAFGVVLLGLGLFMLLWVIATG